MANATIKDVARRAGVSIATVSRVLNKSAAVRDDLVQRVNQAIEDLGYYPNSIARTLKNDNSKTVGFVVSDIANEFFSGMVRSVEDVLNRHGYNLFVCSTDGDRTRESSYLSLLREKQVDGIIINVSGKNDELITNISNQLPVALFSRKVPCANFRGDFVDNDNFSGIVALTNHLLELGHRRIGLINGQSYLSTATERLEGFCSAMRTAGITVDEEYPYLYNGNFNRVSSGGDGAKALYEKGATALIAANNLLALGALQFCHEQHLLLPEQLSLCCFGRISNLDLLYIRPTCIEQYPAAMGARLAELIIERIESKNTLLNREIRFPTLLLPGNGTGAPRADSLS